MTGATGEALRRPPGRRRHRPELLPLAQRCDDLVLNFDDAGVYRLADPSAADDLAELVDLADQQRGLTDRRTYQRALGATLGAPVRT